MQINCRLYWSSKHCLFRFRNKQPRQRWPSPLITFLSSCRESQLDWYHNVTCTVSSNRTTLPCLWALEPVRRRPGEGADSSREVARRRRWHGAAARSLARSSWRANSGCQCSIRVDLSPTVCTGSGAPPLCWPPSTWQRSSCRMPESPM
jgi:hypothetical protein